MGSEWNEKCLNLLMSRNQNRECSKVANLTLVITVANVMAGLHNAE